MSTEFENLYALYFMVSTKGYFKIGITKNLKARAAQVMPNDLVRPASWAVFFRDEKRAKECEKSLHKLFSQHQITPLPSDGGTEFFSMECYEEVQDFVKENITRLDYMKIELNGKKLWADPVKAVVETTALPERLKRNRDGNSKKTRSLGTSVPSDIFLKIENLSIERDRKKGDILMEAYEDLICKYNMQ